MIKTMGVDVEVATKHLTYIEHQCSCGNGDCHRLLTIKPSPRTNFTFLLEVQRHKSLFGRDTGEEPCSHLLNRNDLREMAKGLLQMADESVTKFEAAGE